MNKHDLIEMIEELNDDFNIVQNNIDPTAEEILEEIRHIFNITVIKCWKRKQEGNETNTNEY